MTLYWGENRAIFEGNVRTHIEREPDAAAAGQPATGDRYRRRRGHDRSYEQFEWRAVGSLTERGGVELALGAAGALAALLALSCPAAWAQTPIGGFSSLGSGDSKKPIDIESDRLEVDDKKHTAIFVGNVSATQGDNNLKAPRLEVFYESANQAQGRTSAGKPPRRQSR